MKSLFHFDLHVNYTHLKLATQNTDRRLKPFPCHKCHYNDQNPPVIQETYIQYMQSYWLLEVVCMSHRYQLWLTCPFPHQWDYRLSDVAGAAWENVSHESLIWRKQKGKERKNNKNKSNHIYFCTSFSSYSMLYFSAHSRFMSLFLFPAFYPSPTAIASVFQTIPIPHSNSLQCHLLSTSIF